MKTNGVHIAGCGWVTPGGVALDALGRSGDANEQSMPDTATIQGPAVGAAAWRVLTVDSGGLTEVANIKRMRRAGRISLMAVSSALRAAEAASIKAGDLDPARTAVVFASSNGSVEYSRRFYAGLCEEGAGRASPLLFPETVYNAPSGHIAAALDLDGPGYAVAGDNTVGFAALQLGCELIETGAVDHVFVCGAEETDWIVCDGYAQWTPLACDSSRGMIFSEGAGCVVLNSTGPVRIEHVACVRYRGGFDRSRAMRAAWEEATKSAKPQLTVSGCNGSIADRAERWVRSGEVLRPKEILGESLGAAALWQVIIAASAISQGRCDSAAAVCAGTNQQAAVALLAR